MHKRVALQCSLCRLVCLNRFTLIPLSNEHFISFQAKFLHVSSIKNGKEDHIYVFLKIGGS